MKAKVEVADHMIWLRHVHGSGELLQVLEGLSPNQPVTLKVSGELGPWRKAAPYARSGRPTPALVPLGSAKAHWGRLFHQRKGEVVDIEFVPDRSPSSATADLQSGANGWERAPEADRAAAWEAFKALMNAGWRSDGSYGPRDELYDRDER